MSPDATRFALAVDRAVSKTIEGDAIVIDTFTGRYYSLEGPAEVAWSLLLASRTVGEVAEAMALRYDAAPEAIALDVRVLVDELVKENLLVPSADAASLELPPVHGDGVRAPYSRPELTVFRDMEDLLAFDPPLPSTQYPAWTADSEQQ